MVFVVKMVNFDVLARVIWGFNGGFDENDRNVGKSRKNTLNLVDLRHLFGPGLDGPAKMCILVYFSVFFVIFSVFQARRAQIRPFWSKFSLNLDQNC